MANASISPDVAIRILRYHPTEAKRAKSTSSGPYTVCLLLDKGIFTLDWSADEIGDWDWVGLYRMTGSDNNDYVTYQWAKYGPTYNTEITYQAGYQARYLRWDSDSGEYVVVASTQGFPATQICSS